MQVPQNRPCAYIHSLVSRNKEIITHSCIVNLGRCKKISNCVGQDCCTNDVVMMMMMMISLSLLRLVGQFVSLQVHYPRVQNAIAKQYIWTVNFRSDKRRLFRSITCEPVMWSRSVWNGRFGFRSSQGSLIEMCWKFHSDCILNADCRFTFNALKLIGSRPRLSKAKLVCSQSHWDLSLTLKTI